MKRGAVVACAIIFAAEICASIAHANSYFDMITEPPQGYTPEDEVFDEVKTNTSSNTGTMNWWYDSRIKTRSPVVVSPYPKYYAWAKAKADENKMDYTDTQIQDFIYAVEGGLVGWGLYEIYRYGR